jgi:cytochrome c oxidase subunit 3
MGGISTTIVLGGVFTLLQGIEYVDAKYSLADRAFGRGFFLATGFHGTHVLIGTLFLSVTVARQLLKRISPLHHLGFEFRIWY